MRSFLIIKIVGSIEIKSNIIISFKADEILLNNTFLLLMVDVFKNKK
jgi:hypothetical protein